MTGKRRRVSRTAQPVSRFRCSAALIPEKAHQFKDGRSKYCRKLCTRGSTQHGRSLRVDMEDIIHSLEPRKAIVLNAPVRNLVQLTRMFGFSPDKLGVQGLSVI